MAPRRKARTGKDIASTASETDPETTAAAVAPSTEQAKGRKKAAASSSRASFVAENEHGASKKKTSRNTRATSAAVSEDGAVASTPAKTRAARKTKASAPPTPGARKGLRSQRDSSPPVEPLERDPWMKTRAKKAAKAPAESSAANLPAIDELDEEVQGKPVESSKPPVFLAPFPLIGTEQRPIDLDSEGEPAPTGLEGSPQMSIAGKNLLQRLLKERLDAQAETAKVKSAYEKQLQELREEHEARYSQFNEEFGNLQAELTQQLTEQASNFRAQQADLERQLDQEFRFRNDLENRLDQARLQIADLSSENIQHMYRNKQLEVAAENAGLDVERIYDVRPADMDRFQEELQALQEPQDDSEDEPEDLKMIEDRQEPVDDLLAMVERECMRQDPRQDAHEEEQEDDDISMTDESDLEATEVTEDESDAPLHLLADMDPAESATPSPQETPTATPQPQTPSPAPQQQAPTPTSAQQTPTPILPQQAPSAAPTPARWGLGYIKEIGARASYIKEFAENASPATVIKAPASVIKGIGARLFSRPTPSTEATNDQQATNNQQMNNQLPPGAFLQDDGITDHPTSQHTATPFHPKKKVVPKKALPPLRSMPASSRKIIRRAVSKIEDTRTKKNAFRWFKEKALEVEQENQQPGEKRKREVTAVKIDELKNIPARAPWQPEGSFGLADGFFSDSDEEVPDWYILHAKTADEKTARRLMAKRLKTDTDSPSHLREEYELCSQIFNIAKQELASKEAAIMKEARRTGHVEGTGIFCTPGYGSDTDSSDGDEEMMDVDGTANVFAQASQVAEQHDSEHPDVTARDEPEHPTLPAQEIPASPAQDVQEPTNVPAQDVAQEPDAPVWTQQPPPAPTPAHATLPARASEHVDPAHYQRVQALKYAPSKPSRLRLAENLEVDSSPTSFFFPVPVWTDFDLYELGDGSEVPQAPLPILMPGLEVVSA